MTFLENTVFGVFLTAEKLLKSINEGQNYQIKIPHEGQKY